MSDSICPLCGSPSEREVIIDTESNKVQSVIYHCPNERTFALTPYLELWLFHEVGELQKSAIKNTIATRTLVSGPRIPLYSDFGALAR